MQEMLVFGYPPGYYVRQGDPTPEERMRRRIKGDYHAAWHATSLLFISDDADVAPLPEGQAPDHQPPPPPSEAAPETIWMRYVHYPTSYFNSDVLPCCWPLQLPPLEEERPRSLHPPPVRPAIPAMKKRFTSIPPWRKPGAFGPPSQALDPVDQVSNYAKEPVDFEEQANQKALRELPGLSAVDDLEMDMNSD